MAALNHVKNLAQPWSLGSLKLKNRIVMSSLTRNRGLIPGQVNVDYYAQRAGAGLILSEGVLIEPQGTEWPEAPGIWSKEQISGWKKVTDAVHERGGAIFAQIWHVGRVANTFLNSGVPPPAPSAIQANAGKYRMLIGKPGHSMPRAIDNPKEYVQMFKQAAINAKEAGFDGVEVHGCGGYLVHEFLESRSNSRTDDYGGSVENRSRFALEIIDALKQVYNSSQIGIKLTPSGGYNDMGESEEKIKETYTYLIKELEQREIGYVHLSRYLPEADAAGQGTAYDLTTFLPLLQNTQVIFNGGFEAKEAEEYVESGKAAAISFGRNFIPNPDLSYRLFNNLELTPLTNYFGLYSYEGNDKHVGYSDYPNHPNNKE